MVQILGSIEGRGVSPLLIQSLGVFILHVFFSLRKVELVVEDAWMPKGSCCDDGRFVFGNCGNWWYNCPSYGLQNYTTWARFGDDGFTIPLATPHSAKCIYHSKKRKCPKPLTCKRKNPRHRLQLCGEMGNNVTIP